MPVTEEIKPNELGGFANYKEKYSSMKNKLKAILYENELAQDELRRTQRELLDIYRDKEALLERVIQYEDIDTSSSDSESQQSDIATSDSGNLIDSKLLAHLGHGVAKQAQPAIEVVSVANNHNINLSNNGQLLHLQHQQHHSHHQNQHPQHQLLQQLPHHAQQSPIQIQLATTTTQQVVVTNASSIQANVSTPQDIKTVVPIATPATSNDSSPPVVGVTATASATNTLTTTKPKPKPRVRSKPAANTEAKNGSKATTTKVTKPTVPRVRKPATKKEVKLENSGSISTSDNLSNINTQIQAPIQMNINGNVPSPSAMQSYASNLSPQQSNNQFQATQSQQQTLQVQTPSPQTKISVTFDNNNFQKPTITKTSTAAKTTKQSAPRVRKQPAKKAVESNQQEVKIENAANNAKANASNDSNQQTSTQVPTIIMNMNGNSNSTSSHAQTFTICPKFQNNPQGQLQPMQVVHSNQHVANPQSIQATTLLNNDSGSKFTTTQAAAKTTKAPRARRAPAKKKTNNINNNNINNNNNNSINNNTNNDNSETSLAATSIENPGSNLTNPGSNLTNPSSNLTNPGSNLTNPGSVPTPNTTTMGDTTQAMIVNQMQTSIIQTPISMTMNGHALTNLSPIHAPMTMNTINNNSSLTTPPPPQIQEYVGHHSPLDNNQFQQHLHQTIQIQQPYQQLHTPSPQTTMAVTFGNSTNSTFQQPMTTAPGITFCSDIEQPVQYYNYYQNPQPIQNPNPTIYSNQTFEQHQQLQQQQQQLQQPQPQQQRFIMMPANNMTEAIGAPQEQQVVQQEVQHQQSQQHNQNQHQMITSANQEQLNQQQQLQQQEQQLHQQQQLTPAEQQELEQHLASRRMEQAAMMLPDDWESNSGLDLFAVDSGIKFMAED